MSTIICEEINQSERRDIRLVEARTSNVGRPEISYHKELTNGKINNKQSLYLNSIASIKTWFTLPPSTKSLVISSLNRS